MKNIAIAAGLIIGLIIGRVSISEKAPAQKEEVRVESSRHQERPQFDFEEYLTLKNEKEKYLKAEELYGKMMVMFLASLGLREQGIVKQIQKEREDYVAGLERKVQESEILLATKESELSSFERKFEQLSIENSKKEKKEQKPNVPEVVERFQKSTYMSVDDRLLVKDLFGEFSGNIILNGKGYFMVVKSTFRRVGAKRIDGEANILLYENSKEVSNSTSRGDNRAFRSVENGSNSFIVEMNPDEFAELKYVNNGDFLTGTIYDKTGKQIGKVPSLYRQ